MQTGSPALQAPCWNHFCSLCHCFLSCRACSEHRTFWGTLASVPLGQGSAQQGSDPSWTPSMLHPWEPHTGTRPAALTQNHPVPALDGCTGCSSCNQQHHRSDFLHAQAPAALSPCLTPSVFLLHPGYLNNLPTTWNNWEFARITCYSAQLTDRNETRNVTCPQSQEMHTVDASLWLRASLTAPITNELPFPFLSRQAVSSCHRCWIQTCPLGCLPQTIFVSRQKKSQKEMRLFGKDFTEKYETPRKHKRSSGRKQDMRCCPLCFSDTST